MQVRENSNGDLTVLVMNGPDMMGGFGIAPGFTGTRVGNRVSFTITDNQFDYGYVMVERIAGVGDLGYRGTATGTINSGKIVATFIGTYTVGSQQLCQATDHLIVLTPTGS